MRALILHETIAGPRECVATLHRFGTMKCSGQKTSPAGGESLSQKLAQLSPQDLSRGCTRQGLHEIDFAWHLVMREALRHEFLQTRFGLLAGHLALAQHHEGARN